MEDRLIIERRVPSPNGDFLGVRATIDGKGHWSGVRPEHYDAREPDCEASAIAHAEAAARR